MHWRALVALTDRPRRPSASLRALRDFAVEALAIHHEHRVRDLPHARELALYALEESVGNTPRADGLRHRLARLERKIARRSGGLFS